MDRNTNINGNINKKNWCNDNNNNNYYLNNDSIYKISRFNNNNYIEEKYNNYIILNYKELIKSRNDLIEQRKEINDEYSRLINNNENYIYKNILEQKFFFFNSSLKEIRGYLINI